MSIEKRVANIKDDLDFFDEELAKYEYIIDLGKKLPPLINKKKDDKLFFYGTSDAIIVKGLVYIILDIFSNSTIDELKEVDMDIIKELNLSEVITPNRQSGVIGMIKKIKEYALKA